MSKSINKKAWIRGNNTEKKCPFGLPVTIACAHAGDSVAHMCPLNSVSKDKKEKVEQANKRVYIWYKDNQRCIYAHNIIESKNVVNCDYGDVGQGMGAPAFAGSPLYAQTFSGVGLDGLYAFPLGFYADNNESRNLFQGLFSLLGENIFEIVKNAIDKNLWEKVENDEDLSEEEQKKINKLIEKYYRG